MVAPRAAGIPCGLAANPASRSAPRRGDAILSVTPSEKLATICHGAGNRCACTLVNNLELRMRHINTLGEPCSRSRRLFRAQSESAGSAVQAFWFSAPIMLHLEPMARFSGRGDWTTKPVLDGRISKRCLDETDRRGAERLPQRLHHLQGNQAVLENRLGRTAWQSISSAIDVQRIRRGRDLSHLQSQLCPAN